ncbi:hypothetical protein [Holophaga foetida]|uniref:hypothetical protein n=1 Tax=Holophaga foetida TaxID=35839 RepID=UPI0002474299|nr:hypothetical protein [Holophaga foetida]
MNIADMILLIWTESSVYEVDPVAKQIRRTGGVRPPTQRIGLGWKPFLAIEVEVGASAKILWRITPEGVAQTTITSEVMAVEVCAQKSLAP